MDIEELLFKLANPQIYTAKEINVNKKDFNKEDVNICLVFPDTYEIGMSHHGIKILYHILNNMGGVNAERCFLPEKKSISSLQTTTLTVRPLCGQQPLSRFWPKYKNYW